MTNLTSQHCVWCSSDDDVADFRNEPRCARCRAAEQTIVEARNFISFYGLRPLGGSLESEDEEERGHRVAAREARAELARIRTSTPPRSKPRAAAPTAKSGTKVSSAAKTSSGKAQDTKPAATSVSRPDRAELTSRAEGLLAQLTEIEQRLAIAQQDSGLSGKAKVSDLTAKRDSVLRTLAALEKAKRALEPA